MTALGIEACCDESAHQQIPPVRALGSEYVGVRYRNRYDGKEESQPWRMIGAVNGTVLQWEPSPPPGAPTALGLGQVVQFNAPGPFVVKSQDEQHPFYISAHMLLLAVRELCLSRRSERRSDQYRRDTARSIVELAPAALAQVASVATVAERRSLVPVLSARNLSKAYGSEPLLADVSLTLVRRERVGLLGMNGAGKSTLLRVLSGSEQPDTGVVERRRGASVLYLAQEPKLDPEQTPRMIVEDALVAWKLATGRHAEISRTIEGQGASPELLSEQAELLEQIEQLGGWSHGHVVDDMLEMLGVRARDRDRLVGTLSGGELRRVALARILVAAPSLALLDEPTNHLDVETIAWLEEYLAHQYSGAVLLVTHDRYMLDAVCQRILELDRGTLSEYQGNYGDYLEQKAERLAHEQRVEQNRLNLLRREQAWLLRGAKARSTKQKARVQRAQALIAVEPSKEQARLELDALELSVPRTSKAVLDLLDVELSVADKTLISGLTLHVLAGERIGIIGPNGSGKTSLLKAVTGELEPAGGRIVRGTQTRIALFDQARAALRDDWSILDNVAEREDAARLGAGAVILGDRRLEMRTYLELFLFDSAKQRQTLGSLSGGERARVALAKILKSGANLLLLDEPTNDLDVATLSSLEELLQTWPGSALIVSHDRFFLDRVATSILAFEGEARVVRYPGNYSTYLSLRPNKSAQPDEPLQKKDAAAGQARAPLVKALTYAEKRELERIVDLIAGAEERAANLEQKLADPRLYADGPDEARGLRAELQTVTAEVSRLMARWEELETRREATTTR